MEELKLLVEMVASLPQMALWVVAFFFIYKVVVIGSIYGVIRFCVGKVHDIMVKERPPTITMFDLDGIAISLEVSTAIKKSLKALRRQDLSYIHMDDVELLNKAIITIKNKEVK